MNRLIRALRAIARWLFEDRPYIEETWQTEEYTAVKESHR